MATLLQADEPARWMLALKTAALTLAEYISGVAEQDTYSPHAYKCLYLALVSEEGPVGSKQVEPLHWERDRNLAIVTVGKTKR